MIFYDSPRFVCGDDAVVTSLKAHPAPSIQPIAKGKSDDSEEEEDSGDLEDAWKKGTYPVFLIELATEVLFQQYLGQCP